MAGRAQPGPSTQKPPANVTTPPVPSMVPGPKASTSMSQKKRCGRAKVAPTPTAAAVAASGPVDPLPGKISWEGGHTDALVTWIISRPADRHVLYHD